MRIARFTTGDDPQYGVVTGDVDEFGIPADDSVIVALAGDPLYVGIQLDRHRAPTWPTSGCSRRCIPRSKVVGIGKNYAAHAAEMGSDVPDEPLMFLKPNTSVVGPGDPIFYPPPVPERRTTRASSAVVIGRICRDVPAGAGRPT